MSNPVRMLALLLLLGCLGGCSGGGDLKDIELVSALAADRDEAGIGAAVQILQRDKALEPQYAESYYILRAASDDMAAAVGELYKKGAQQLNFSHTTILLLGEEAAGLADWLGYAVRSAELRPTLYPVIVDGQAYELLAAEDMPQAPVYLLSGVLEPMVSGDPGYAGITLQEFVTAVQQPGQCPVLPSVSWDEDGLELQGFAVYDDERPAGLLTGDAALGWLLLKRSAYLHGYMLELGQDTVLELQSVSVNITVQDEPLGVCWHLDCRAEIAEMPAGITADAVRQKAEQRLQQVWSAALAAGRTLGLDHLGIGHDIYRRMPDVWQRLVDSGYQDDYLNMTDCRMEAVVQITGGY